MKKTILGFAVGFAVVLAFSIAQDECSAQRDGNRDGNSKSSQLAEGDREKLAWYGTLDSALSEAKRTERPIFLVAARPECRGVPGKW